MLWWALPLIASCTGLLLYSLIGASIGAVVGGAMGYSLPLWLPKLPYVLEWFIAVLPLIPIVLGGLVEGLIAETMFNQWWHWRAFAILMLGFLLLGLWYGHLAGVPLLQL